MWCVPPCASCQAAGICPKGQRPAALLSRPEAKPTRQRVSHDRSMPDIQLECEHSVEFQGHMKRGRKVYCETCCKYRLPAVQSKPETQVKIFPETLPDLLTDDTPPF